MVKMSIFVEHISYYILLVIQHILELLAYEVFAYNSNLTPGQLSLNFHLSRAHTVVENAFGQLKGRWLRLMKCNDMNIDNGPYVITTCCILHKMCEDHGDSFNDLWLEDVDMSTQPELSPSGGSNVRRTTKEIRDALMKYYS